MTLRKWLSGLAITGAIATGMTWRGHDALADAPPGHFNTGADVITDTKTGLVWQRTPIPGRRIWSSAETECANLSLGGFDDWRLPTLLELHSLIDAEGLGPVLLDSSFQVGDSPSHWSKTRDASLPNHLTVDVELGSSSSDNSMSPNTSIARCVR